MCIPGRYATIMNFEVKFDDEIQWNKVYNFIGQVVFKSSINSISEKILVRALRGGETVYAQGK